MRAVLTSMWVFLWAAAIAPGQAPLASGSPLSAEPGIDSIAPRSLSRWWARGEYLVFWIKDDRTPGPLVTTGPVGDPAQGAMGNPATKVLYDGSHLDYRMNSGARLDLGLWLDDGQRLGLQVAGFVLETHTIHGKADSERTIGAPVIARPFFNVLTGQEEAAIITSPQDPLGGRYLGGIDVFGDSRTWGGEVNLVHGLMTLGSSRWELLGGFRYLGQKDQLRFSGSSTVLTPGTVGFGGAAAPAPDIVSFRDYLETLNHFYGGQIGAKGEWRRGRWTLELLGKIGLGATCQFVSVSGNTLLTDSAGNDVALPGGLYALPSNIGDFSRTRVTFISEAGASLGLQLTPGIRTMLGYSLLYWGDVARPGNQIDRRLDPRQIPSHLAFNPNAANKEPPPQIRSTDFWAQGLTLGLELRY